MAKSGLMGGGGGVPTQMPPIFSNPGSVFRRGVGGILPERGSRQQLDMVQALLQTGLQSSQGSGSPLLAFLAPLAGGAVASRTQGLYKDAQQGRDQSAIDQLMAAMGGGVAGNVSAQGGTGPGRAPAFDSMAATGGPTNAAAIREGLLKRGMPGHVADAFVMNFNDESGLNTGINEANPMVPGSRGGFGLAQWTGPRRKALEAFAAQRGKPVADLDTQLDFLVMEMQGPESEAAQQILSARDTPQAAAAIVNEFLRPSEEHRARRESQYLGGTPARDTAARVASGDFSTLASAGQSGGMGQEQMRELIGLMTNPDVSAPIRDLASTMVSEAMGGPSRLSPSDQIDLAGGMLDLETALMPPKKEPGFRPATPEEAAQYGAQAGQIGPDGRFYPATAGNTANNEAAMQRQQNEAAQIIQEALGGIPGVDETEKMAALARNPIYRSQLQMLGINPDELVRAQEQARLEEKARTDAERAAETAEAAKPDFFDKVGSFLSSGLPPSPNTPAAPTALPAATETDPLGIR